MRLFYASFLDLENMRVYEALVTDIAARAPNLLRPIPPRTHHLTMAFLGEIEESDLGRCMEVLDSLQGSPTFDYSLARPRILYARRSPRLICTDVAEGAEKISSLQTRLCGEILQRFPESQIRAQNPHITLARFKRNAHPKTARPVAEALSHLEEDELPHTDRFVSIHLVKSALTPSGPVYESLGEVRLSSVD